jgi:hypothetical protein
MALYSFKETMDFFSEKLQASPPEEDLERGEVELVIDNLNILLSKGKIEGCMQMQLVLGLMLQPIRDERLKDLATSNFLGINTGGCKLSLDEAGIALSIHAYTTCGCTPQENWEWLHRLICVALEWNKVLALWDEFVPLITTQSTQGKDVKNRGGPSFRA